MPITATQAPAMHMAVPSEASGIQTHFSTQINGDGVRDSSEACAKSCGSAVPALNYLTWTVARQPLPSVPTVSPWPPGLARSPCLLWQLIICLPVPRDWQLECFWHGQALPQPLDGSEKRNLNPKATDTLLYPRHWINQRRSQTP